MVPASRRKFKIFESVHMARTFLYVNVCVLPFQIGAWSQQVLSSLHSFNKGLQTKSTLDLARHACGNRCPLLLGPDLPQPSPVSLSALLETPWPFLTPPPNSPVSLCVAFSVDQVLLNEFSFTLAWLWPCIYTYVSHCFGQKRDERPF